MAATTNNYVTKNLHGDVMDNGVQKVILNATIRPGRYLQLHVEVLDPAYVAENEAAVGAEVDKFIRQAREAASTDGLPTIAEE